MSKTAVALGSFDGLHIAHQKVLKSALSRCENAVCLSFVRPPAADSIGFKGVLMQPEIKRKMLYEMGFYKVELLEFQKVKHLSASEFLDYIKEKFDPAALCCGYNYTFGKNREGTAKTIAEYCKANGIEAIISEQVTSCGSAVSSQRIREMVEQGDIKTANALLSRELFFEQTVQHGDMRGRTIGFPTVNQQLPGGFVVPKFGVYASHVTAGGKVYRGVTNIGIRPTFRLDNPLCETYIIGADGDMYGKNLTLSLYKFIRPERKFDSLQELQQQIEKDRNAAL